MNEKQTDVIGLGHRPLTCSPWWSISRHGARFNRRCPRDPRRRSGGDRDGCRIPAGREGRHDRQHGTIGRVGLSCRNFNASALEQRRLRSIAGGPPPSPTSWSQQGWGAGRSCFNRVRAPEPSLSESQKSAIRSAKILHLTGRYWKTCLQAIDLARDERVRVSFDGGADRFRP